MRDIIIILIFGFIVFHIFTVIGRLFIHSDEIKICIQKELFIEPLTKCSVSYKKENLVCFTAIYHGQDLLGKYYKITCNSTQIEIPERLAKFVVFITKKKD